MLTILRQGRPDLVHAESHSALHGSQRLVEHLGDLGVAESSEVRELDDARLVGRQVLDRAPHLPRRLTPQGLGIGELLRRAPFDQLIAAGGELRRATGLLAQEVDRPVADDAERPGADAAASAVIPRPAPPDREQRLLGDVLAAVRLPTIRYASEYAAPACRS